MSFIAQMEDVAEIVSDWVVDSVFHVFEVLCPDGRPWGWVEEPLEDQILDYMYLRGDPQAWAAKILEDAEAIQAKLMESGLPPAEITSIHPYDLAIKFALDYSRTMEEAIAKREGNPNANNNY